MNLLQSMVMLIHELYDIRVDYIITTYEFGCSQKMAKV